MYRKKNKNKNNKKKQKHKQTYNFRICNESLHTAAAPAVRVEVKTELLYRKDTIIVFFFPANKNKDNA